MNKTYLIFKHEFLLAIRRPGFIILTLIVPVMALLGIGIIKLVSSLSDEPSNEIAVIGYVDEVGIFDSQIDEYYGRLVPFSSVSIRQLLMGKIFALGFAGLLQVLVWLISAPIILNLASSSFGGFMSSIQLPANFLILGIIYFVLGYLLFAVLSIGIGAISLNAREGSQLSMFYVMLGFVPLWLFSLLMAFPNSSIWVVLSIFPSPHLFRSC